MKRRMKLNKKYSSKLFTKTAKKVNKKNMYNTNPMRGGIRL